MRGRAVLLGSPHSCRAALLGAALALATPLKAQEQTKPPVLSPSCGVPMTRLAAPASLPHLTAALKDKTTIHIVAMSWRDASSTTFSHPKVNRRRARERFPLALMHPCRRTS